MFCILFNDVTSNSEHTASNYSIVLNYELKKVWKVTVVAYSKYYADTCLEGLRKTTNNLTQDR
jgi:hypothetical protein